MSKFCANCGKPLEDHVTFCPECGSKQDVSVKQPVDNGYNPYAAQQANPYQQQAMGVPAAGTGNMEEALKWFSYKGRLNRQRYFLRGLAAGAMAGILGMIGAMVGVGIGMKESTAEILVYLFAAPGIVLSVMTAIKRSHDLDKPGLLAFATCIPFVGGLVGLYLLFAKGTDGPNQYGDDPLKF